MKRGYKVVLAVLGVLVVIGLGGFFYMQAPDMRPIGSYFSWFPTWFEVKEKIPFLHAKYEPPPPISSQATQLIAQERARFEAEIFKTEKQAEQIFNQLKSAGLPVTGAYIVDSENGEQMLALEVPLGGLFMSSGNFMNSVADSMIKLADAKTLDLSGLSYVNLFVRDDEDRIIFGVAAKTSDIQSYRAGKMTLEQFFSKTAAAVESRFGALEALAGGVMP